MDETTTTSVKLHVYRTEMGDAGTENCDYRGGGELAAGEHDQHRTVGESDPAPDELVELVKEHGAAVNAVFLALARHAPDFVAHAATLLGLEGTGPVALRIGLWDK